MKRYDRSLANISTGQRSLQEFQEIAAKFLQVTSHYAFSGLNPGGTYKGIWTRDASFIIEDWFCSGKDMRCLLDAILHVWSHQIITANSVDNCTIPVTKAGSKVIYGRGSPNLRYCRNDSTVLLPKHSFEGALPTTIFQDFAEVYGEKPDIDSTALMISATSSVLTGLIEKCMAKKGTDSKAHYTQPHDHYGDGDGSSHSSILVSYDCLLRAIDSLIPCLLQAVKYLDRQDVDGDGLLEQGHNEDWMDTALRSGKIVYSQASWLLALGNLYSLLSILGYSEQAKEVIGLAKKTIHAVEKKLWSEQDGCYFDLLYLSPNWKEDSTTRNGLLTQDVCLYLVALSEYLHIDDDDNSKQFLAQSREYTFESIELKQIHEHVHRSLDAIQSRIWSKNEFEWPLVTENVLEKTGPRLLDKNEYHNHAFWPWITGIEMLARSRFGRLDECLSLLSIVISEEGPKDYSLYEWIDPNTMIGNGAVPFRTGISSLRLAISDYIALLKH